MELGFVVHTMVSSEHLHCCLPCWPGPTCLRAHCQAHHTSQETAAENQDHHLPLGSRRRTQSSLDPRLECYMVPRAHPADGLCLYKGTLLGNWVWVWVSAWMFSISKTGGSGEVCM